MLYIQRKAWHLQGTACSWILPSKIVLILPIDGVSATILIVISPNIDCERHFNAKLLAILEKKHLGTNFFL